MTYTQDHITVARMYVKQIEHGILDNREKQSCIIVSDYMRSFGTDVYLKDICLFASLLGFLDGGRRWNRKLDLYSMKDLNTIKN